MIRIACIALALATAACSNNAVTSDAGIADGAVVSVDATPPLDLDGGTTFAIAQPVSGTPVPTTAPLHGPGLILMGGGTDVDAAFVWMHDTLAGSPTATMGNIVVINCQSAPPEVDNGYTPYIYGLAPFQSVMTIYLGGYPTDPIAATPATPADLALAAYYVDHADGVFFSGGDQADYVSWRGTPLMTAITALYNRGGVIGGTSAGCSILGPYVFDDLAGDDQNVSIATADAVADPFETGISFTHDMLTFPSVPQLLADPHFVTRDRFGRLAAFVARQYADGVAGTGVIGVGIDESNALLVDKNGVATLVQQPSGSEASTGTGAYILQPDSAAATCTAGQPLKFNNINVLRLSNPSTDSFDFHAGTGIGTSLTVSVNGSHPSHPYSPTPY